MLDPPPGSRPNNEPVGDYDLFVTLAERYHWTPEQICRMDPDFLEEVTARIRAEAEAEKRKARRKHKHKGGSGRGEPVDLSEIQ